MQVSCDTSPAFIRIIRDEPTEKETAFDKFHIIKIINETVDSVRLD